MRLEEIKNVLQVYADYLKKHFSVNNELILRIFGLKFYARLNCQIL